MVIQVNTDKNIAGGGELPRQVEAVVEAALGRFGDRITRVEVYLTDESSSRKSRPDDKRCVMEARLAGLQPIGNWGQTPVPSLRLPATVVPPWRDRSLKRQGHHGCLLGSTDRAMLTNVLNTLTEP